MGCLAVVERQAAFIRSLKDLVPISLENRVGCILELT